MPARCSRTKLRRELLRTCNEQRTSGGNSRRRVCLSFGRRRKSKNSDLLLLGGFERQRAGARRATDFGNYLASSDGERPAEGRAAQDDEGLRTCARTTGEPAAEGRTARRGIARANSGEKRGVAHDAAQSGAMLVEREPVASNSAQAALCSRRAAKFVLRGSNVRHERWTKGREAAFGTSARWRG